MKRIKDLILLYLGKAFNSIFFLIGFAILLLGLYFYFGLGSEAKDALETQMLHREQANARVGASSIGTLFDIVGKSVVRISSREEVVDPSGQTDELFALFVKQWENTPVTSIILLNKEGIVTKAAYSDREGVTGTSLADRDYFIWSKTAPDKEYYVSGAISSRLRGEDYYVVVLAAPIKDKNGGYKGALAVGVSLTRLAEQYLAHLKISDATEIYLIKHDGTFLYSYYKELLGLKMFDYINEHPFLGDKVVIEEIKKRLADIREGKAIFAYPVNPGAPGPLKPRLIAYSPLTLQGKNWILVIATPVEDALISMGPIYLRFLIGLLFVFLALLAISIRFARIQGYKEGLQQNKVKLRGSKREA